MFLLVFLIFAAPMAPVFTSSIFLRCILFIMLFVMMIIMVSILWSVYHAYHDRMQCGVETSYAWLRKPNELVHEFCQYHFHNFNGDIIYLMTLLQMILLQNLRHTVVLHCTSWGLCCLLCLFHYESVVPVIFGM
jgi:hypothetical protein